MPKTNDKHDSISFGAGLDKLIAKLIGSGRFNSKSEVVRAGLRLLKAEEEARPLQRDLQPFTKEEAKKAFAPDREWDALETHLAKHSKHRLPEPD